MKDKLLRYEELKKFQESVEEELEALAVEIIKEMERQGSKETPPLKDGKIILASRKKWSYSEFVGNLEEAFKKTKESEQAKGIATYEETTHIRYVPDTPKSKHK